MRDCKCENCNVCGGLGALDVQRAIFDDKFVPEICQVCDGTGVLKRCPEHAKEAGWLDDPKPKTKR